MTVTITTTNTDPPLPSDSLPDAPDSTDPAPTGRAGAVASALARVVRELPGGGEAREGQVRMAEAVADAIAAERHLVVRAGTGTGKTLGYLVPAIRSGRRVVVATATKALQDQLAAKDLPFLDRHLDQPFSWAVLKGRSNYACVQRLAELAGRPGAGRNPGGQLASANPSAASASGVSAAGSAGAGSGSAADRTSAGSGSAAGSAGASTGSGESAGGVSGPGASGPGASGGSGVNATAAGGVNATAAGGLTSAGGLSGTSAGGLSGTSAGGLSGAGAGGGAGGNDDIGSGLAAGGWGEQLALDGLAERADPDELAALAAWASTSPTGDRAELPVEPSDAAWSAISTGSRDCPGAARCPRGDRCFTEAARARAAEADVVVVNLHLYGLDLAADGALLPEHDVAVVDEAHQLDDIISATTGVELGPGRFTQLGRVLRGILAGADDTVAAVADAAGVLIDALVAHRDRRLTAPLPADLAGALAAARGRVETALAALRAIPEGVSDDVTNRAIRARQAAGALLEDLDAVAAPGDEHVLFVTGPEHAPALRLAPLDVAGLLSERLWSRRTAVLTSATLAPGFGPHVGLLQGADELLDVGSPFDFPAHGLIYCAVRLPRPTDPRWADAAVDELAALIQAAGGRTLALFTSYKAMNRAAQELRIRLPFPILAQGDLPKPALVDRFAREPETCLFATMSFWQGIDVPGPSLSLVTIDRLPFPRPDDPLLQARREHAGPGAFIAIDVPRAATLLAQGAGRLIRTASDRGAVAVLDPRLATAAYGPKIVATLPRMRRTRDRAEIEAFLRELREAG